MGKWFVVLLFALLVYMIVKGSKGRQKGIPESRAPRLPEDMVACGHCGVNLPKSEALLTRGRFYCCEDHGRLGAR
jgi:uncharacterized protein